MTVPTCVGLLRLGEGATLTYVLLDALTSHDAASLRAIVTDDELRAAERMRRPADALQKVAGRAAARIGLSLHAPVEPAAWNLVDDPRGKPQVSTREHESRPWFSIAHTRGLAVCAVSDAWPIGVDCERIAPRAHMAEVARRTMQADELNRWLCLADEPRIAAFYETWTAKEAVAKAIGLGIQVGMARIAPSGGDTYVVAGLGAGPWRVLRPDVSAGHCVAVALPDRSL